MEEDQKHYADLLQNDLSKSQTQIEQEMIQIINNQETFVLNSPSLSFNEKEYIITVLEIQKQYLDYYYSEISSIVTDNGNILMGIGLEQNKRRTLFGKLWRGLTFLAISLATSGKFTALAAKLFFKAAGKSALFTSSMKAAYFQLGIGLGWIPSWYKMVSKEKWNSNPWGDGSVYGWQKFALNIGLIFGITV